MTTSSATGELPRERAFVGLIQAHQASVWRYLRFLGCDEAQETFLAVWAKPFEDRGAAAAAGSLPYPDRREFLRRSGRTSAGRCMDG